MLKKFTAVLLSAFIIVLSIPFIKSNATDVTVDGTFGDATSGYTNNDFLTSSNYINYYNDVDGYLKYCTNYDVYLNNNDADYGSNAINTVLGNINNLNTTEYPSLNGKKISLFTLWRSSYTCYLYNIVVDGSDDIFFVNNMLCSKSQFTIKERIYSCGAGAISGNYTIYTGGEDNVFDDTENIVYDSTNQIYYREYSGMLFYSEVPVYLTYSQNNNYNDGDYLGQSPYNYQTWQNVANAVINDTDKTGFVIDRRTEKMIDNTSGGGSSGDIVSVGYDENLFEGVLGFNWFNPSATLNYNNHTQLYYPYFIFNYQINNYTNIHKTSCSIVVESSIGLCLRYNLNGSPYQTISHFSNNQTLLLTDNIDKFIIYGSDQGSNTWKNTSLRSTKGFGTATGLDPFEGDLTDDIKTALSQYGTNGNIDYAQSYALFKVNFYIKDNITGDISETYQAQFDLYNNKYSDNKEKLISNDNQEFIDFKNSFDYQQNGDDLTPVNYANDVSGGQGGNSIVTITNPQFPYLLVDIPEGEWMSKTPNLTTILTDFKDALSEVKDNSILNVMSETYNYLPVPVWQYFTYGVGILIAIGIWRAITRR